MAAAVSGVCESSRFLPVGRCVAAFTGRHDFTPQADADRFADGYDLASVSEQPASIEGFGVRRRFHSLGHQLPPGLGPVYGLFLP